MFTICTSGNISRMDNIIHGANPEKLYRFFNIPMPEKIIDFSTNTNIITWPDISINLKELASHYPDPECTALRELVASRENLSPSRILFTNGINEAIFLLSGLFGVNTAILQPCYSEYSRAFTGAHNVFTLSEAGNFRTFILANPNNPTGEFIPDLSRTIARYPDTTFIVDEAYIDFLIHEEPERLCDYGNVIILRSLTKIFHLSGARIGYVVAGEGIIGALKRRLPTWSVNGIAQELALRFLNDGEFLRRTREFYRKTTPEFMNALRRTGFEVRGSAVHYFIVRVGDDMETVKVLLPYGLVVRHTRNFAGLEGKYIRVATRQPEENERLVEIMRKEILS